MDAECAGGEKRTLGSGAGGFAVSFAGGLLAGFSSFLTSLATTFGFGSFSSAFGFAFSSGLGSSFFSALGACFDLALLQSSVPAFFTFAGSVAGFSFSFDLSEPSVDLVALVDDASDAATVGLRASGSLAFADVAVNLTGFPFCGDKLSDTNAGKDMETHLDVWSDDTPQLYRFVLLQLRVGFVHLVGRSANETGVLEEQEM